MWRQQIQRILEGHGLLSFTIHPDYVRLQRAQAVYKGMLDALNRLRADQGVWVALPRDVNRWWRQRSAMELVADGAGWRIEGCGSARARVAYARVDGERVVYEIAAPRSV